MTRALDRRTVLKSAGVALALPIFESVLPRGYAAGKPDKPVKRMVCLSNNYGVYQKAFFPEKAGRDYALPPTLRPLERHRADFTVFSNLDHGLTGGHACVPTFLNGIRPDMAAGFPEGNISMDQKAAEFVGAATRYPSLTLKVKETNQISFTRTGVQVPAIDVVPQPKGKPMLIHTPSTLLEVLGTQFDVEASQASTMLNVTEGKVRVRRLSDGREVDVPARHRVIAEGSGDLTPQRVPESVNHWKSQLHLQPGSYGKWLPATEQRAAAQKAIPLVPRENPSVTLYLLGIPVSRSDGPPVVVRPDSQFVVRGRLNKPAKVHFGIAVSYGNGEFAGKFRGDLDRQQPISEPDEEGQFEVIYRIGDFTLDPCVRDRKEELAARPDDLVLNGVWAFTHAGAQTSLQVSEVELIPPERKVDEAK